MPSPTPAVIAGGASGLGAASPSGPAADTSTPPPAQRPSAPARSSGDTRRVREPSAGVISFIQSGVAKKLDGFERIPESLAGPDEQAAAKRHGKATSASFAAGFDENKRNTAQIPD